MTKEKLLNQEYQITVSENFTGYEAFENYFQIRAIRPKAEGIFEVVLVSDEWDRYNTTINPNGFVGVPSTVEIRYNHGGVDTGAYLENLKEVNNYGTGEFINGQERVIKNALVGEIHVPKTAEQRYRTKDGQVLSNGNLYEAMSTGKSKKVSVGFIPVEARVYENDKITIYDCRNTKQAEEVKQKEREGIKIEYAKWDMPELSVLDTSSGQATSVVKQIRSLINNNMSKETQKRYLNALVKYNGKIGVITKELEESSAEGETKITAEITFEDKSTETVNYTWNDDDRPFESMDLGQYVLSQFGVTAETQTPETEQREITVEADSKKPEAETPEQETPEADENGDGEISDEEMRNYIKEVKRAFGDKPGMMKEKMDELERMCGDIKKRMDDMAKEPEKRELTQEEKDEIEAQEIAKRALNSNLSDIPEKVKSGAGDAKRSLGKGGDSEEENKKEKITSKPAFVGGYRRNQY